MNFHSMSLSHQVKPTTSGFSSSTSTFLPHQNSTLLLSKSSSNASTTFFNYKKKTHLFKGIWCLKKQNSQTGEKILSKSVSTYRRNLIAGLGGLTVAAGLTSMTLMDGKWFSAPTQDHDHQNQLIEVKEFGSQARKLETPIRVLVTKPKIYNSRKGKGTYVLIIEGIDVLNDEPVRFDVFVAKPQGGGDQAGPEYGEFAGSLIDLARPRSGRNSTAKGSLELGISCLLKQIGATDSNKLVITLKPRSGEVTVSGVRVEYVYHED